MRKCRFTTEKEIIQACQEFQNKMTPKYFQKYINKLKEAIQKEIKKETWVCEDKEKLLKLKNELLDKFNGNMNSIETSGIIDGTQTQNQSNNQQQQNEQQPMRIIETQVPQSVNNSTVNLSVNDLSIMLRQNYLISNKMVKFKIEKIKLITKANEMFDKYSIFFIITILFGLHFI